MNVKLPSGTVVANVPDDMTQQALLDRLARTGGYEEDVQQLQRAHIVRPIGREGLPQAARQAAEEMTPAGKIGANLGLGMQTTGEGIRGVADKVESSLSPANPLKYALGAGRAVRDRIFGGAPDEGELARQKGVKEQFAEAQPGGKWTQLAGEIAPTLAVPAGAAESMGARALPWAMRALDVAGTGAVTNAAMTPGGPLERGKAALYGAVGGVMPLATAGGKGIFRAVRPTPAGRVAGREAGIAERMARDLGEEKTGELVGKLDTPTEEFTRAGVKEPTAAQLTRDPALQQLETGLRVQRPDLFKAIDEAAASGRWDEVAKIAKDEGALSAKMQERSAATDKLREAALAKAGTVQGFEAPVAYQVEQILTGASRTNPQARTLANWVQKELGEGVTPEQLYSMRKALTSGIPHGTELGSAMTQARQERVALVASIDEALEAASGGQWKQYLGEFAERSAPITSMKAGQGIQKAFETTANRTAEGVPVMTAHALRKAVAKHGEKQFGSKTFQRITPEERATLESVARSIEAENAARMAQGTIGSATAGNLAASNRVIDQMLRGGVKAATGAGPLVDIAAHAVGGLNRRAREEAYAQLLRDPQKLRQALEAARTTIGREQGVGELARGLRAGPGVAQGFLE